MYRSPDTGQHGAMNAFMRVIRQLSGKGSGGNFFSIIQ